MLWTALRYPALPLERLGPIEPGTPRAVAACAGSRRVVLACDALAAAAGVRAGLALSSALALAPGLVVAEHDAAAQAAHLELLALAAIRHSSLVAACPPDTVLIESGASLQLFGGIDAFVRRLRAAAAADALSAVVATAPTPAGARTLARAGVERSLRTVDGLRRALAPLDPAVLDLDARTLAGLRRSGVRDVGALLALPPAAVARRFGRGLSDDLYRLDGRLPDPQVPMRVPRAFLEGADLPAEAASSGALAFLLRRLLGALGGFLRGADLGVGELRLTLAHRHRPPTLLRLRLAGPSDDVDHLARTVGARLERTVLEAPVVRVELEAAGLGPIVRTVPDLIEAAREGAAPSGPGPAPARGAGGAGTGGIEALVDELAARLGPARVYTALARDEHRPEAASGRASVRGGAGAGPWPARPLWLLRAPREAPPALELASGPERIESGWWDEADVRRDYFIARDARGVHYWVYRTRGEPGGRLWIHGLFA